MKIGGIPLLDQLRPRRQGTGHPEPMTVRHLLEAELEILDAVTFYKEGAGDIAADFFVEFSKARDQIAAFPEFWKPVGGNYHRKLLERFPYGIIYRVE